MLKLFGAFIIFVLLIKCTYSHLCGNCDKENRGLCTIPEPGFDCLGPEFHNSVILDALKLGMTPHSQLTGSKVPIYSENMEKCLPQGFEFTPRRWNQILNRFSYFLSDLQELITRFAVFGLPKWAATLSCLKN